MTLGYIVARRLTSTRYARAYPLKVTRLRPGQFTVPVTEGTAQAGTWGVLTRAGSHFRVTGDPVVTDAGASWALEKGAPELTMKDELAWTGVVDPNPTAAGMSSVDSLIQTGVGTVPAWFVDSRPGERRPIWAVHIHGLGSTRAGTLRGVAAASGAGVPSVAPAIRNAAEGPKVGRGRSHLGSREVEDIEDVLESLSIAGDERFVLFGWSMGAQVALQLAADDRWRDRIICIVLDSPVLDWRRVLTANVAHAGVPAWAATAAESWLERPWKARAVGLDGPVNLDQMDWVARAAEIEQPVLIHHGSRDWSVPLAGSEAFAAKAPSVTLAPNAGGHTTGWNVDPGAWHSTTLEFVHQHVNAAHMQR